MPYVGAAFRRTSEEEEEVELLIIVTPELVAPLDCGEVPQCFPGMHSDVPNDCQLYWKGYVEVPSCGPCGPGGCAGRRRRTRYVWPARYDGWRNVRLLRKHFRQGRWRRRRRREALVGAAMPRFNGTSTGARPSNADTRYNPPECAAAAPARCADRRATGSPGIIGPVGYDVLK